MPISLARRVERIKPSSTLAVAARALRLKSQGKDIISFGQGEPDFDTPVHIADSGIDGIRSGCTRYTNVTGTDELKDAVISKFMRDNRIQYDRSQILISCGAKQAIYNLCMAILDPGDEVIIPAPYWVSYPEIVQLADGLPVMPYAGPAQGYKITPRQLAASITAKTRLLLLNSPCNPTGAAYTYSELRALGEVLLDHPRVLIGTDDIYEKIYWGPEQFCSLLTAVPELYPRTLTINGVSKAYAMTGWRIGYCGGPREIITAMATIQGQSTSNASSIAQKAATVALNGDQSCVDEMNRSFKARHDFIIRELNSMPGVSCLPGVGAFYAFADVTEAIVAQGCRDDIDFADLLINEADVAVVPGTGFGAPGHIRLSFACSMQLLKLGADRIRSLLNGRCEVR